ncbi:uncharacterized protein LOC133203599 [Saccostrea echinata]|uniref:uncharacterized protein LOC133203599 n=1 Tax=Saccostrea echinata TaxID=191078 RepID=UPI002A804A8A|nr:uncharacterized protein LOC133203599 [Saccostrea echinata]
MAAPTGSVSVNKTQSSELLALEIRDNGSHLANIFDLKKKKTPEKTEKKTFRLPPSSILSQVRDFLPQMEMANKALQDKSTEELDIEQVSDDQGQFIEMNIAVVEQNGDISEDSDSEHCSDSDCDINSDSDECLMGTVTENNLRVNKKVKHKPNIEELPNTASDRSGACYHQSEHKSVVDKG